MRSIAIINQKGGVGKTTTAVNVAAALARDGQRVLLLDLDPQSHASLHLGIDPNDHELSIYDVITQGAALADAAHGVGERLVVVPAHIDLVGAEVELATRDERETVLRRTLNPYQQGFDFCMIDCAPSLGLLTVNALAAVHEVIIPLQAHFLALQGLGRLLDTVGLVRQSLNPGLHVSGVVLCMYETATRLAQEVADDVRAFVTGASPEDPWYGATVFATPVRRNIKLAECPSFGQTVFEYAPSSHGAEDYRALAREILAMPASKPAAEVAPSADAAPTMDVPREASPEETRDAGTP